MWTSFTDRHSGGPIKQEPYEYIYVEAEEKVAVKFFETKFGHHPADIYCDCCGENYYVDESDSLEEATRFERSIYGETVEEYIKRSDVLIIYKEELI